jgi:hypothetical protein
MVFMRHSSTGNCPDGLWVGSDAPNRRQPLGHRRFGVIMVRLFSQVGLSASGGAHELSKSTRRFE